MSRLIIGVTGGIGSGKTAVTDYFSRLGITIVDADLAARVVVEPGKPALKAVAEKFGAGIIQVDGSLDRRQLRNIIFRDDQQRIWLEQLLHPLIRQQIEQELTQSTSDYTMLVSPLLIETDQHTIVDRILLVDVPVETQLSRTMARDNMTEDQTRAIINKQASRELKLKKADDVVDNSGSLDQLYLQLEQLHWVYSAKTS